MSATPDSAPAPVELLHDLLLEVDSKSGLAPLFERLAAQLLPLAAEFGFQVQGELLDVGVRVDSGRWVFSSASTLIEKELGRHICVCWELHMSLVPTRFGSSALCVHLCESGEASGVQLSLGHAGQAWWADMTAGWTPQHAAALTEHVLGQWTNRDTALDQRLALESLDLALAC